MDLSKLNFEKHTEVNINKSKNNELKTESITIKNEATVDSNKTSYEEKKDQKLDNILKNIESKSNLKDLNLEINDKHNINNINFKFVELNSYQLIYEKL